MFYLVGLGNPGEEYKESRHNTGRMAILKLLKDLKIEDLKFEKKANALISKNELGKEKVTFVLPETFMNKSGSAISYFIKPKTGKSKAIENLVVIYDDIDLPIGTMKISFNKGSGGHRGVESIIKAIKTREFARIRIGISPTTPSGKIKKPEGEKKVLDFILGNFKPKETEILKKVFKQVAQAVETMITESREIAMNRFNQ